jgi:hypothetical protein
MVLLLLLLLLLLISNLLIYFCTYLLTSYFIYPVSNELHCVSINLYCSSEKKTNNKRKIDDVSDTQASLEAEVKQLRNELKNADKLQERLTLAEEQNTFMRAELNLCNKSPQEIKRKNEERISTLLKLIRGFNTGDVETVRKTVASVTSPKCSILTPSLFQELRGKNAVVQFFCIMLETFPDGFFELHETELEESGVVISKFLFSGTKIAPLPSDLLYEKWKDLSLEEICKKRAARHIAAKANLAASFLNIRAATSAAGGRAAVAAAAQTLPAGEISNTLLQCMMSPSPAAAAAASPAAPPPPPPPPAPRLHTSTSNESAASNESNASETSAGGTTRTPSAKHGKTIKISGHIIATFDALTEEINRIIFVWNTTSLLGQTFGFSDGDLEVLNEVMSFQKPGSGPAPAPGSSSSSSSSTSATGSADGAAHGL